jgi:hypothetical protein
LDNADALYNIGVSYALGQGVRYARSAQLPLGSDEGSLARGIRRYRPRLRQGLHPRCVIAI